MKISAENPTLLTIDQIFREICMRIQVFFIIAVEKPFKDEAQTALFKYSVRTAL
jgi:hypothetical protein